MSEAKTLSMKSILLSAKHSSLLSERIITFFTYLGPHPTARPSQLAVRGLFKVGGELCDQFGFLSPSVISVLGDVLTGAAVLENNRDLNQVTSLEFNYTQVREIREGEEIELLVVGEESKAPDRTMSGAMELRSLSGQLLGSFTQQMYIMEKQMSYLVS